MPKCRNPECRNGVTPGIVMRGRGKHGRPLFGNGGTHKADPSHWGWVSCPACNPKEDDAPFKPVKRTAEEIAQRAQMATDRTEYKPQTPMLSTLRKAAATAPSVAAVDQMAQAEVLKKIEKLMEGQNELLDQIKELRAENKELKAENARLKQAGGQTVANVS